MKYCLKRTLDILKLIVFFIPCIITFYRDNRETDFFVESDESKNGFKNE